MEKYYLVDGRLYDNNAKEIAKVAVIPESDGKNLREHLEKAGLVEPGSEILILV